MFRALTALAIVAISTLTTATAQTTTPNTNVSPNQYPPALPHRKGPATPKIVFTKAFEIPVPGPLPPGPLVLVDGRLELAAAGVIARLVPAAGQHAELAAGDAPQGPTQDEWLVSPDGQLRYRAESGGRLLAEHRSRWARDGWSRAWRLRVSTSLQSPPILIGRRLCFAAMDDQVYCVRADNGHRLWATDLGNRLTRPMALWTGTVPETDSRTRRVKPRGVEALLVVPDGGGAIVALDVYDGKVLGRFDFPTSEGWITSPAAVLDEGRIAVARQGYRPEEAGVAVFDLSSPEATPGPDKPAATVPGAPAAKPPL